MPVIGWSASTFSPHLFVEQEGTYSMTIRSRTGLRSEHPIAASSGSHPRLSPHAAAPPPAWNLSRRTLSQPVSICPLYNNMAECQIHQACSPLFRLVPLCARVCGRFASRCSSGDSSLIFGDSPPPPLLPPMPRHCVV